MTQEEILNRLCVHDERNPTYAEIHDEDDTPTTECGRCDNCFYGRTKMANYILKLQSVVVGSAECIERMGFPTMVDSILSQAEIPRERYDNRD